MVLQKEPFKRCRGHRLRRGTRSLPLLKRAQLYWQATGHERTDRLRLTQSPGGTPIRLFSKVRRNDKAVGKTQPCN
jgi:hypothetical protein